MQQSGQWAAVPNGGLPRYEVPVRASQESGGGADR
jgi:hypothetical protein